MTRHLLTQRGLETDSRGGAESNRPEGILIIQDGRPVPMIPAKSGHLAAVVAPGIRIERHAFSALEVSQHFHPTHCLHLQTGGVSRVRWRSEGRSGTETMRASSLMLHGQGTWDSMTFAGESSRIVVSLDPASITKMMSGESERPIFEARSRWHFQDRQLERLIRNLETEAENGFRAGRIYGELLGLAVSEYLMQHYSDTQLLQSSYKGGLPRSQLDRVLEYIAANLSQALSLTEVAAISGLSAYHFARLFKMATGISPHQYVLAQRIERAKQLLLQGKNSVIDVALESGFNDPGYFSRIFRKVTGVSPNRYRSNSR